MGKEVSLTVKWRKNESHKKSIVNGVAGTALVFVVILTVILLGLKNTNQAIRGNGLRVAKEAVMRAAVSCYALEGSYPESYAYLKENYAVNVNEALYIVDYTVFASNIMPDITVIER